MIYAASSQKAAPSSVGRRRPASSGGGTVRLEGWPGLSSGCRSARHPVAIIEGNLLSDADQLRAAIWQGRRAHGSTGGLYGWVGFDGSFCFGVFPASESTNCPPVIKGLRGGSREPGARLNFIPQMTQAQFVGRVRRAQEYIAAGDIYQVNLSYPWQAVWPRDLEPADFYERLRVVSPAPYAAYLDLAGTQLFSASPECFLRMKGDKILTRPIKGTRPRSQNAVSDARLREELLASAKERAELVMITDLERNDVGKVCEYGSVRVTELLSLESFAQVHHLVSTVEGTLRRDVDHVEAFLACFPGGSISGAPKKRALEIIHELEPQQRGLYTGAIGCFGFDGESHFSIAIRTAWKQGDLVQFHTGAGIVADSIPELEYEETRHKAAGILQAASGDELAIQS